MPRIRRVRHARHRRRRLHRVARRRRAPRARRRGARRRHPRHRQAGERPRRGDAPRGRHPRRRARRALRGARRRRRSSTSPRRPTSASPSSGRSSTPTSTCSGRSACSRPRARTGAKIVFASTGGAIYGECDAPATEDSPRRPLSPYGTSKLCGEEYLATYNRLYGTTHVGAPLRERLRPAPEPARRGRRRRDLLRAARRGEADARCSATGSQQRDYVYVGDVARAVARRVRPRRRRRQHRHRPRDLRPRAAHGLLRRRGHRAGADLRARPPGRPAAQRPRRLPRARGARLGAASSRSSRASPRPGAGSRPSRKESAARSAEQERADGAHPPRLRDRPPLAHRRGPRDARRRRRARRDPRRRHDLAREAAVRRAAPGAGAAEQRSSSTTRSARTPG